MYGHSDRALLTRPKMARGCELCFMGVKAVIFITGLCDDGCYYCPVNREKLYRDVFYVNETPVASIEEVIVEVERTGASSASITGGDPLTRPDRTIEIIEGLKNEFSHGFHIHLYTSGRYATPEILKALEYSGLDEIRFHPTRPELIKRVETALRTTSMDVGIEIPIGPGLIEWAKQVILKADRMGASFVNLNELEFVEPNAVELLKRGFRESRKRPFTVEGAYEAAVEVLKWAEENVTIPVHFCPAVYKDAIQTRNRLVNTARRDKRWFEEVTRSGTLIYIEKDREGKCIAYEVYPTPSREPIVTSRIIDCNDASID
ncbi:MAG: radical SAM protein [Desulfurococcales archaeon]|nr:radical SAM protein [Desulfurococcales archaeon]